MKVVFDTNVLVAATIASGVCKEVFEFSVDHDQIFISPSLIEELEQVLIQKLALSGLRVKEALHLIKSRLTQVVWPGRKESVSGVKDKDDWPHLWFCQFVEAHLFVTGDKEVLTLNRFGPTKIIPPNQYWTYRKEFLVP